MKAFLWFLMYQKGREAVAMNIFHKFEVNVDEIQNQGAQRRQKKTDMLPMVSPRLDLLGVKGMIE